MRVPPLLLLTLFLGCGSTIDPVQASVGPCTVVDQGHIIGGKTCHESALPGPEAGANKFVCACNASSSGTRQLRNTLASAEADTGSPALSWYSTTLKKAAINMSVTVGNRPPVVYNTTTSFTEVMAHPSLPDHMTVTGTASFEQNAGSTSNMEFDAGYTRCVTPVSQITVGQPASNATYVYLQFHVQPPFPLGVIDSMTSYVSIVHSGSTVIKPLGHRPAYDLTYGFFVTPTCAPALTIISNNLAVNGKVATCTSTTNTSIPLLAAVPLQVAAINITAVRRNAVAATWVPGLDGGCPVTAYNVTVYATDTVSMDGKTVLANRVVSTTNATLDIPAATPLTATGYYYLSVSSCSKAGCSDAPSEGFAYHPSHGHPEPVLDTDVVIGISGGGVALLLIIAGLVAFAVRRAKANRVGYQPIQ